MNKVKERLQDQILFFLVDETTVRYGTAMTTVLSGPLDGRFKDQPFLLDLLDFHAAINQNIQPAVTWALFKVFVKILTTTVYTCSSLIEQLTVRRPVEVEGTLTQHDVWHRHLSRSQQGG
ncbi:Uncharacterized protein FKW44_003495 [Caligus rogercresseyi]|uniref:Uncharacterized protein n=1 Tax=Caligus rogercresseyi TaxID=217165 RepID=A0A7T8KLR4_CALRO|nr:Uncharacterized protein FKW44_003495 [Caligus rogercresseyi]